MFDAAAAAFTEKYITTLIIGLDVVPRLNMRSVLELRVNALKAIQYCKSSKLAVITVTQLCKDSESQ